VIPVDQYPVLIQFGYKARRGKDTACATIQEEFGSRFKIGKYAYADALRGEVYSALFDLFAANGGTEFAGGKNFNDPDVLRETMEELCFICGVPFDKNALVEDTYPATKQRKLYQWWGTEYRRSKDHFYWVNKLRETVEKDRPKVALISDARFRNEFAYAQSFKGYNVKLVRPDLDEREALTTDQAKHQSEVELDAIPDDKWYRVIQHTSVEDLRKQVVQLMDDILAELEPPAELKALSALVDVMNAA
jgi:hypothetical protein